MSTSPGKFGSPLCAPGFPGTDSSVLGTSRDTPMTHILPLLPLLRPNSDVGLQLLCSEASQGQQAEHSETLVPGKRFRGLLVRLSAE